jgi:hypothetical protein
MNSVSNNTIITGILSCSSVDGLPNGVKAASLVSLGVIVCGFFGIKICEGLKQNCYFRGVSLTPLPVQVQNTNNIL